MAGIHSHPHHLPAKLFFRVIIPEVSDQHHLHAWMQSNATLQLPEATYLEPFCLGNLSSAQFQARCYLRESPAYIGNARRSQACPCRPSIIKHYKPSDN
jgi:hypothetical protein